MTPDALGQPSGIDQDTDQGESKASIVRWTDMELERGRIAVVQQRAKGDGTVSAGPTKIKRSRRPVPLDPRTVEALREHRKQQREEQRLWGEAYEDHGLVFTLENGTPLHPMPSPAVCAGNAVTGALGGTGGSGGTSRSRRTRSRANHADLGE